MKQSLCIISFSPIYRDARVLRQIKYLSAHYDLTVIGYGHPHPDWQGRPEITWMPVDKSGGKSGAAGDFRKLIALTPSGVSVRSWPFIYDYWYWRKPHRISALEKAASSGCSAFHANDWEALPVAAEAAARNEAHLVFDAHEYAPLEFEDRWYWKWLYAPAIRYFLHKYSPVIDASTTVAPLIAQRYQREFNLNPIVVLNAPERCGAYLSSRELDPHTIRLIHHGIANRARRLEKMIETVAICDRRYRLHFMLMENDTQYIRYLKHLAEQRAPGRVIFHQPVPPEEIVGRIAEYEIGFCLIEPSNYNYSVSLPNKFFDFIAAGLAVCIGPSPSMAEIVHKYGLGCVAETFDPPEVAKVLNQLDLNQLMAMRQSSRKASEHFNAD